MAISPLTISELFASGRSAADIMEAAAASGVTLAQLDGVSSWAPIWHPASWPGGARKRFDFSAEQNLDMASALGLDSVLLAGAFDPGALELDVLVESFGVFCDAARDRGMRVELEFVPFWGIPDLPAAWDIVQLADRPESGLLVDTWHLQKGTADFERDLALLETIPPQRLANIQLADATLESASDTVFGENRFRRFPGDGELAIDRVVSIIAGKGGLRRVGAEIFGAEIDQLTNAQAGERCASSTRDVLDRVGLGS